ncbi:MAG: alpha-amylase/4-alpha-glucanotransferase domain-containing protein [Gemmatimonadaceae bacterium]
MSGPAATPGHDPLLFVFGVHLHQPVGNFDEVFADHARDVYRPLIAQISRRRLAPALFHISGPLLEWLDRHDSALMDDLGRLASEGRIEFLLGGMYEPILAAIPRADRVEQIVWLREALLARFGVSGDGLWLTERVWEPDLPFDLAAAGVRYVLLDDRHFLVTGFSQSQLHVPWRTESNGSAVSVLAIDQRLRYLIPFRPPEEIAEYMRRLQMNGELLAIFADDGEKFGGWPGTKEWVYGRGWFDKFCDVLDQLQDEGVVRIVGGAEAIASTPSGGLAYLPTASYHEMEAWALPAAASVRLTALEEDLGSERMAGPDGALIRGSHWKNFLTKYSESNRIHKKMLALSALCRAKGDPPAARRAIARGQCNDALWHGVFGGLYLPHLREALWRQLAIAEGALREGDALEAELVDFDADGSEEVWIHSSRYSAIVAPARGGAMIEFTDFETGFNYADTLTRRIESYHLPRAHQTGEQPPHEGTPSIHELEASLVVERPPTDLDDRAIGVARVISGELHSEAYAVAAYRPTASWARARCTASIVPDAAGAIIVRCTAGTFAVEWRFPESGVITASYRWHDDNFPEGSRLALELSVAHGAHIECPSATEQWRHDIETVAKSERGMDRTKQGEEVVLLFDAGARDASFTIRAGSKYDEPEH